MNTGALIAYILLTVLGLGGLFIAARAEDSYMAFAGAVFFIAAVLGVFGLIKSHYNAEDRH